MILLRKNNINYNGDKWHYSIKDKILESTIILKFNYQGNDYELNVEGVIIILKNSPQFDPGPAQNTVPTVVYYQYKPIEKRWEVEEINGLKFIKRRKL